MVLLDPLFRGCTRVSMDEIEKMDLKSGGVAVRDVKLRLAREIVGMFWGAESAKTAEDAYITQFRKKEVPDTAETITIPESAALLDLVVEHLNISRSEAKRKFAQNAISINGEKVTDVRYILKKGDKEQVLRIGRKVFRVM